MNPSNIEIISKSISYIRFPLIVGVVLIHSTFGDIVLQGESVKCDNELCPIYYNVSYILSHIIARICVPLFFMISGYLFFYKSDSFDFYQYVSKLKKRIGSLLVPYVIWNLISIIAFLLIQIFCQSLLSGRNKSVLEYNFVDWLLCFWDTSKINGTDTTAPINYPLWYLRDLMVTVILSPLIYYLLKHFSSIIIIILGVLYIFPLWQFPVGINPTAIFFFSLGAFISIRNLVDTQALISYKKYLLISYVLGVVLEFLYRGGEYYNIIHHIVVIIGVFAVSSIVINRARSGRLHYNKVLSDSSFFIFVYHALPLAFIVKVLLYILPNKDIVLFLIYLIAPTVIIFIGVLLSKILDNNFRGLSIFLKGSR